MAGVPGFEPEPSDLETVVLPGYTTPLQERSMKRVSLGERKGDFVDLKTGLCLIVYLACFILLN